MMILSLALQLSIAFAKPTCDISALSRNCGVFADSANKEFIELADGTRYPNPLFVAPPLQPPAASPAASLPSTDPEVAKKFNKAFDLESKLQTTLLYSDPLPGTELFRTMVTSQLNLSSMSYAISLKGPAPKNGVDPLTGAQSKMSVHLPWPPNTKDAEIQDVDFETFRREYVDKLSPQQRAMISTQMGEVLRLSTEAAAANQPKPLPYVAPPTMREQFGISPARELKVAALIEESRKLLLDEIARGKPRDKLSRDEAVMYDKVKTVKVTPLIEGAQFTPACTELTGNASYDPRPHTFSICPGAYNLPDTFLVQTIAHEMAHSIDFCNLHNSLFYYKRDISSEELIHILSKKMKVSESDKKSILSAGPIFIHGGTFSNKVLTSDEEVRSADVLVHENLIDRVVEGLPYSRNPYQAALACLTKSLDLRRDNRRDLKNYIEEQKKNSLANLLSAGTDYSDSLNEAFKNAPNCISSPDRPEQFSETAADLWGTKVIGRYAETHLLKNENEVLGTWSIYLPAICDATGDGDSSKDSHARGRDRVDKIFLTDRRFQAAIGCSGSKAPACVDLVGTLPSKTSRRSNANSAGSVK